MNDYFEYEATTRRFLEAQVPVEQEKSRIRRVGIGVGLALAIMNLLSYGLPRLVTGYLRRLGYTSPLNKPGFWYLEPELYYAVYMAIYLCLILLPFAVLIPCLRLKGFARFPFRRVRRGREALRLIAIGFGACLLFQTLATMFITVTDGIFGIESEVGGAECGNSVLEKVLFFISLAVLPALAEEFAFRGVVLGALRPFGDGFAVLMSALVFGLMHGNLRQIPFAFACGLIMSYMTVRTESVWPSVCVHFLNNMLSVCWELIPLSWLEWAFFAIYGIGIALSLFFTVRYMKKQMDAFSLEDYHTELLNDRRKARAFFLNPGMICGLCAILGMLCLNTKLG